MEGRTATRWKAASVAASTRPPSETLAGVSTTSAGTTDDAGAPPSATGAEGYVGTAATGAVAGLALPVTPATYAVEASTTGTTARRARRRGAGVAGASRHPPSRAFTRVLNMVGPPPRGGTVENHPLGPTGRAGTDTPVVVQSSSGRRI